MESGNKVVRRPWVSEVLRRVGNVADAMTQLGNALALPRPFDTDANESISGRCFREGVLEQRGSGWVVAMRSIDWVFSVFGEDEHCRTAYYRDLGRARDYQARAEAYREGGDGP